MSDWIRWWKDRTFLVCLGIALLSMSVAFVLAYFIEWGWLVSVAVALIGGYFIRRMIYKRLDELCDD